MAMRKRFLSAALALLLCSCSGERSVSGLCFNLPEEPPPPPFGTLGGSPWIDLSAFTGISSPLTLQELSGSAGWGEGHFETPYFSASAPSGLEVLAIRQYPEITFDQTLLENATEVIVRANYDELVAWLGQGRITLLDPHGVPCFLESWQLLGTIEPDLYALVLPSRVDISEFRYLLFDSLAYDAPVLFEALRLNDVHVPSYELLASTQRPRGMDFRAVFRVEADPSLTDAELNSVFWQLYDSCEEAYCTVLFFAARENWNRDTPFASLEQSNPFCGPAILRDPA